MAKWAFRISISEKLSWWWDLRDSWCNLPMPVCAIRWHTKLVTCQAHYTMSVQRVKSSLDASAGNDFAKEAFSMEKALTVSEYQNAKKRMCEFIDEQQKKQKLMSWLSWWDYRKSHWALAYRPTNNAPLNNLSECVHAWEKARGSVSIMLLEAVQDDVAAAIMLRTKFDGYRQGWYTGGTGKSLVDMVDISQAQQMQRANFYAHKINTPPRTTCESFVVDPAATHREDKISNDTTGDVTPKDLGTSTPTTKNEPMLSTDRCERRPSKRRNTASKLFEKTCQTAVSQYSTYSIMEDKEDSVSLTKRKFIVFKKDFLGGEDYIVTIHGTPSCGCMFFVQNKGRQLCKHLIMVLLSLGVNIKDPLLFQIAYTKSELSSLLSSEFRLYRTPSVLKNPPTKLRHKLYLTFYEKGNRPGRRPLCPTCKESIKDGFVAEILGRYRCKQFSTDNTFRFHLRDGCLATPPFHSDISSMPKILLRGNTESRDVARVRELVSIPIE